MQPGERLQRTEMNRGVQEQTGVFTLSVDCVFVSFVYSVQRIMTHRNPLAEVEVRDFWENRPQHSFVLNARSDEAVWKNSLWADLGRCLNFLLI